MAIPYWIECDDAGNAIGNVWVYVDEVKANSHKRFSIKKSVGYSPDIEQAVPSNFIDAFDRADSDTISNGWVEDEGSYSYFYISSNALYLNESTPSGGVYVSTLYRPIKHPERLKSFKCKYYSPSQSYIMSNYIGLLAEDLSYVFILNINSSNKLSLHYNGTKIAESSSSWSEGNWHTYEVVLENDNITVYYDGNAYINTTYQLDLSASKYFFVGQDGGYHQTGSGSLRAGTYRYSDVEYKTLSYVPEISIEEKQDACVVTITNNSSEDLVDTTIPISKDLLAITSANESLEIKDITDPRFDVYMTCKVECDL